MDYAAYTIELWSPNNQLLADITDLCHDRSYTMQRNEAETFQASINLVAFEERCLKSYGVSDPREILEPYWTELRVKRGNDYLFGGYVIAPSFTKADDFQIRAVGYLNYFKYRHLDVAKSYTQVDAATIAANLIVTVQQKSSRGVTFSSSSQAAGVLRDRNYQALQNIKSAIQNLCDLEDGKFDFSFSAFKEFRTYKQIGSQRRDILVVYGGPDETADDFSLERGPVPPINEVTALGSGFGDDQLKSVASDSISQARYGLWQDTTQHNTVELQATLDQHALTDVTQSAKLLEIPHITVTSNQLVGIPFVQVGDRIPVEVRGHSFLQGLNKWYRVERMEVKLEDTDFERIKLYFDDLGVSQSG